MTAHANVAKSRCIWIGIRDAALLTVMAVEGSSDDFAISVAAYRELRRANGLQKKIAAALDEYKPASIPSSPGSSCARGSIRNRSRPTASPASRSMYRPRKKWTAGKARHETDDRLHCQLVMEGGSGGEAPEAA
jgi:hypothetical protein